MLSGPIHTDTIRLLSGFANNAEYFAIVAIAGTYLTPINKVLRGNPLLIPLSLVRSR